MRPILLLLLTLAACANPRLAERDAYLAQFVGQPEAEVVRQLGIPHRTLETGGSRFIAYLERRQEVARPLPMFMPYNRFGGMMLSERALYDQVVERFCEITFEIAAGKVAAYRFHGNGCG